MTDQGVPSFSGSCSEIYLEKAFLDAELGPTAALEVAKELGETSLMFLIHPGVTPDLILQTSKLLTQELVKAAK